MEIEKKYYADILSCDEIALIGTYIEKFEDGEILYKEMQDILKNQGISIEGKVKSLVVDGIKIAPTLAQKERLESKNYIKNDLTGWYTVNSNFYEDISISRDKYMIEVLASYGNEKDKALTDVLTKRIDERVYTESKKR